MHSSLEEGVGNWGLRRGPEVSGPCSERVLETYWQVNSGFSLVLTWDLFDNAGCWMVCFFCVCIRSFEGTARMLLGFICKYLFRSYPSLAVISCTVKVEVTGDGRSVN